MKRQENFISIIIFILTEIYDVEFNKEGVTRYYNVCDMHFKWFSIVRFSTFSQSI